MEYFTFPITQRPPPRSGQRFSWNSDDNDEAARIRDRLVFWGVTTHKWFTYIVRALFYSHPVSTYSTIVDHKRNYYLFIQNCILNGIYFVNIWSGRRMDGGSADCKMNIISCTLCKWLPFQVQRSRGGVLGAEWKGGREESILSNLLAKSLELELPLMNLFSSVSADLACVDDRVELQTRKRS